MSKWTLSLWVLKCLVELALLYTCITRRVKALGVLAAYTFLSALFLMLIFDHLPSRFTFYTWWVDLFGMLIMIYIFIQLSTYVIDGEDEYYPTLITYIGLIAPQFICAKLNLNLSPSIWLNCLNILLWILGILCLIKTSQKFPLLVRTIAVDFMSSTIIPPHQSMLIAHNDEGC